VELGVGLPVSGAWATPANQLRVARLAEALGYRTLWTFQRLLVAARPGRRGGAEVYRSVLDPVASLAFVAGHTERIRLGLAVLNMPFFSPVLLAKQLATLDVLSGGRLDAGLGLGWSPEEFAASGVPLQDRGARGEEFLRVLRALWTEEVVELSGRFYRIPAARMEPKPLQRPHPPLLLGGEAPAALRRAGRLADGWISSSQADLTRVGELVGTVHDGARRAGRDPGAVRIVVRGVVRAGEAGGAGRRPLSGSYPQIRGDLERLAGAGVSEVFVDLNWDPRMGSPDADAAAGLALAEETLQRLAPS
jgi:probable F420-dependent oxidoreductase